MQVRFLQAVGGHEVGDVADVRDKDAGFLLDQGVVSTNTGDVVEGELHEEPTTTAITFGPDGRTTDVDMEQRADRHSGMGAQPLPEDAEPVHFEDDTQASGASLTQSNPFEDTQSNGVEGLKLNELRTLAESRGLDSSGTKAQIIERINADDDEA